MFAENPIQPVNPVSGANILDPDLGYWQIVRKLRNEIAGGREASPSDWCFITSIATRQSGGVKGGVVFPASIEVAARRIAEGTHRTSTQDEISAYKADLAARTEKLEVAEEKAKTTYTKRAREIKQ
jgi:hypothetical protein